MKKSKTEKIDNVAPATPTYMAIDQWGQIEHDLGPHPRKELMARLGKKRATRMYVDKVDGRTLHIGWIIGGRWFTVYEVKRMEREA